MNHTRRAPYATRRYVAGENFARPATTDTWTQQGGFYAEPNPTPHSDPEILTRFQEALARAGGLPVPAGRALWPRFAGYYQALARLPRKARRGLERRWRRSLAGIALLCALGQAPALAATINVSGGCILIDAITAANTDAATGGCPAGSGADTITLPAGSTQTLTSVNDEFSGLNGLPVVRSAIVIVGNGSTIARDPAAVEFRIFAVDTAGDLTLQEATITGGAAGSGAGGGIINYGTLLLTNSTVSGNAAELDGGGVFNSGTATLRNSTVLGNSGAGGGGVKNNGALTVANSTVSGNSATFVGGGVYNTYTMTLTDSTVSGNSGYFYGGVGNTDTMVITNSTISGNSSNNDAGGVGNSGNLTLTNSTVTGNFASDDGGGIFNLDTLTLVQTLVSGNSTGSQGAEVHNDTGGEGGSGTVIADGFNVFGYDGSAGVTGFTPGVTDIVPNEPLGFILSSTLTDDGGPNRVKTHNLVVNSPAIDAAPNNEGFCPTNTDQRGFLRPGDGNADGIFDCDIGSVETGPPPPPTISSPSPLPSGTRGQAYGPVFLTASGGQPPLRWSGTPPAGLALSQAGAISGTPTGVGTSGFNVTVTDSANPVRSNTKGFQITIIDPPSPPPTIATVSPLPAGTRGQAYGPVMLAATGGAAPLRWSGTPPAGLTLSQAGVISGTPTVVGTSSFNATVTDSANPTRSNIASFQISIADPPPAPPPPLPNAVPASQNPQLGCTGSACRVAIKCDSVTGTACNVEVMVFVFARTLQSSDDQAAKAQRRLLFAAGVSNIPAGQTANVRLKLRRAGKQIVRTSTRRRIRGVRRSGTRLGLSAPHGSEFGSLSRTRRPARVRGA